MRGKTPMGWFYSFKLHLIVNKQGELLAVHLTRGNTDDRKPLEDMTQKLFGDKGYISRALFQTLFERGLELITALRKNMKGQRTGPGGWNFAPLRCAFMSKTADAAF